MLGVKKTASNKPIYFSEKQLSVLKELLAEHGDDKYAENPLFVEIVNKVNGTHIPKCGVGKTRIRVQESFGKMVNQEGDVAHG